MRLRCRACQNEDEHRRFLVKEMMFGTTEEFEYFECADCGSVQICENLPPDELIQHYPANYYSFHQRNSKRGAIKVWLLRRRMRHILNEGDLVGRLTAAIFRPAPILDVLSQAGLRRHHRVLDVGCGSGHLLNELADSGFERLVGVDPFVEKDVKFESGVAIYKKRLDEIADCFDVMMFNHSLEHVLDPLETLRVARSRLGPDGICVVRLPTTSSIAYEEYGVDWFQLDAPRHVLIPSREGMRIMAGLAGFTLEKTIDDSYAASFWASEQYRRRIPLRHFSSYSENPASSVFSAAEISVFEERAIKANREGRGDQAAFILRSK